MNTGMLILLITVTLTVIIFMFVIFYIIKSLSKKGVYQVYWTTKKGKIDFEYHEGLFRIKAESIQEARKVGAITLKEKYQNKPWFLDIKFTIRGGGKSETSSKEEWLILSRTLNED